MAITLQDTNYPSSFAEHVARLPETQYAETAFTGDFDDSTPQHTNRWLTYFIPNKTHCHEYLSLLIDYEVGMLRDWKQEYIEPWSAGRARNRGKLYLKNDSDLPATLHFYGVGFSIDTLVGVLHMLAIIGTIVAVGSPFVSLLFFGIRSTIEEFFNLQTIIMYSVPPFSLWLIVLLRKSGLPEKFSAPPKPYLSFHRDSGMVTLHVKKKPVTVPFREIQGVGFNVYAPNTLGRRIAFGIKHKHSHVWARMEGSMSAANAMHRWPLIVRWELITHYMDVTRPLPDIPIFEPFRHLDPTTRAWDKQHKRPKSIWLTMDDEDYLNLMSSAMDAAKQYPLQPKSHNIDGIENWQPAGNGKHWYQLG